MSIEALIENHTKALYAIAEAIKGLRLPSNGAADIQSAYAQIVDNAAVAVKETVVVAEETPAPAKKAKAAAKVEKAPVVEVAVVEETESPSVSYAAVRDMVNQKATAKGKQIRALFDLHDITNLRALLTNPDDMDSEVTDKQKLADIYTALKAL